jgi:hypothetical protein
MKYFLTTLALVLSTCHGALAQTASDSVRSVINRMFDAMRDSDTATLREIMAAGARIETVTVDAAGETVIRGVAAADFIATVGGMPRGAADERIVFETVRTDGPLGIAWTPYRFHFNGKFSHCGVNTFRLARYGDRWKIISVMDTRRKAPCPE